MKIKKSKVPVQSKISEYKDIHYSDSYVYTAGSRDKISADDIMVAFWTTKTKWLAVLFKIRNTLVKPFGLKTDKGRSTELLGQAIRDGADYGFMASVGKTENETIISLDDKHLKAYFSVYIEEKNIYLTTLVVFHNRLGRAYFSIIRPFHAMVMKGMFKKVIKDLMKPYNEGENAGKHP